MPRVGKRGRLVLAVLVAVAALVAVAVAAAATVLAPSLDATGPRGDLFGRSSLDRVAVRVRGSEADLRSQRWTLDGKDVTALVRPEGGELVLRPTRLADGSHTVAVRTGRNVLRLRATREFAFRVDTTPPAISLAGRPVARAWEPLVLRGSSPGAVAVTANGRALALDGDRFVVRRGAPAPAAILLAARDEAGNRSTKRVAISVVPRRPAVPVRAVHVTFYAWADKTLHDGVLKLIDEKRVNAIEIDLKDESGIVGFAAGIPFARQIKSVQPIYDLAELVRQMHARGIRVIGRLVCFRDPIHAAAAWKAGRRTEVIQTPSGDPYSGYGGFTNFASPAVRKYNIDIAVAAARLGVDDVLYDYVRRPDGPISSMRFPGLKGTPEDGIVEFLRESRAALRPYGTYLGASVFGVAATRPLEVAQPVRRMARSVDYVSPMVYPSHWGPGEYRVANPNSQPYDIVLRSLRDFARDVRGTGARVVPWLQDFTLGVTYGPTEVRAQIDAARRDGIDEFLLWDPAVTYTSDALTPDAATSRKGLASARRGPAPKTPSPDVSSAAAKPKPKRDVEAAVPAAPPRRARRRAECRTSSA